MPGNMLRSRKKDVSLKPNRVLDKRGSRGMLYENEELRMRTIHINDEVEKGHNDIKKLKKENEHLKREIWNLRDEYEKLEEMMQRMCATYGNPDISPPDTATALTLENPMSSATAQKYHFRNIRRESEATTSASMYGSEDEEMEDMLMIDEDGRSYDSTSMVGVFTSAGESPEDRQYFCTHASPEDDTSLDSLGEGVGISGSKTGVYQPTHHHLWQHLTSVPPELEVVKEESENTSNSNPQSPMPKSVKSDSPNSSGSTKHTESMDSRPNANSNCVNLKEQKESLSPGGESLNNSFFNPKIEITPAGSPTPSTSQTGTATPSDTEQPMQGNATAPANNATVQNLGCVTLVPKKFQVTSQLRISEQQQLDSAHADIENAKHQEDEENKEREMQPMLITRRFLQNPNNKRRGSQSVFLIGKGGEPTGTLSFPNTPSLLAQPLSPFYQSEPSLSLSNNVTNSSPEVYLSFEDCEGGFERERRRRSSCCSIAPRVHSPQSFRSNPNYLPVELSDSVERYVVIGYIEPGNSDSNSPRTNSSVKCNYELRDLRAQEIIDELENQFDSALEQIVGVRVMWTTKTNSRPIQIFISATNSRAVKSLVEKGLTLNSYSIHVNLTDITTKCTIVTLSGVPSSLSNPTIVSVLNQYGQVIGPLERLSYKGVDISERVARMHLVSNLPSIVNIAGYQILAKATTATTDAANCQDSVESLANVIQGTSVTPVIQHQQTSRNETNLPTLGNSVSLEQIPRVNQDRHSANPTCHDEAVRMRLIAGRPSSPSPSTRTNVSLSAVSAPIPMPQSQTRGGHRIVSRAVSSAPRLETGGSGGNPNPQFPPSLLAKRRMSTWSEISEENLVQAGQVHSSQGVSSSNSNVKRPLSRLLRSSPGSLAPPDSSPCLSTGGGSKTFYRSLSFDPRRNSNASRCYGVTVTGEPTTANGFGATATASGNTSGHRSIQSQMSHPSQLQSRNNMTMGFGGKRQDSTDTQKSLPWCGCWGNGCI